MATSSEGVIDGVVNSGTTQGLYTSLNAGQSWTYNALVDPGGATDVASATSVVYNPSAGLFFAAVRYHGFYSSPDGVNWTRLANQPGGAVLSAGACPPQYAAADPSDPSGKTAYVTVMGFTGGTGHIWKTTNAGTTWTDFTGNLPDSPANAVVVYPAMAQVFVATDVGVFASPTSSPTWTELGPVPSSGQAGYLPNVAVMALGIFQSGAQQLLRASTYGRGIWQFNLLTTPDFQLSISNSPQTILVGQTAVFNGTATALNGYTSSVALSCTSGITPPPAACTPSPSSLTPGRNTPFTVTAGVAAKDYYFNVQGVGSDSKHVTHQAGVVLHILSMGLTSR